MYKEYTIEIVDKRELQFGIKTVYLHQPKVNEKAYLVVIKKVL
ncbi:MAG: hypothetical protein K0S61_3573 [Anaerocolumna sp.]|jgi:hypothetical protein|nr:hypothetical protein [Anaerocolumna sp.]